jgi:hypothetical protein
MTIYIVKKCWVMGPASHPKTLVNNQKTTLHKHSEKPMQQFFIFFLQNQINCLNVMSCRIFSYSSCGYLLSFNTISGSVQRQLLFQIVKLHVSILYVGNHQVLY